MRVGKVVVWDGEAKRPDVIIAGRPFALAIKIPVQARTRIVLRRSKNPHGVISPVVEGCVMAEEKRAAILTPLELAFHSRIDDESAFDTRPIHRSIERDLDRKVRPGPLACGQSGDNDGRGIGVR